MEKTPRKDWDRVFPIIKWGNEFRTSQIRRWLRDDNLKLRTEESEMTKDHKYPEEIKQDEWDRMVRELQNQEKDQYCECHTKCPKCGKKYRRPYHYSSVKE